MCFSSFPFGNPLLPSPLHQSESLNQLRDSPDYELSLLSERKPGMIDELVTERVKMLKKETTELEIQADNLAKEIAELTSEGPSRIG
jgi:hypothetical protein